MRLLQVEGRHKGKFRGGPPLPLLGWQPQHIQDQAHLGVQAKKGQRAMVRRGKGKTLLKGDVPGTISEKKETVVCKHEEK